MSTERILIKTNDRLFTVDCKEALTLIHTLVLALENISSTISIMVQEEMCTYRRAEALSLVAHLATALECIEDRLYQDKIRAEEGS